MGDLCRLLPQLWHSLSNCPAYPLRPNTCLLTRDLVAVRRPGSYELCEPLGNCNILTAAMPSGDPRPRTKAWFSTVEMRIRAVLYAAYYSGRECICCLPVRL